MWQWKTATVNPKGEKHEVLAGLLARGLEKGPKLAVGDGALGVWNVLRKEYPECVHQRCRVHRTANVLNTCPRVAGKVPKSLQNKVKADFHEIWMAEAKKEAGKAFSSGRYPCSSRPYTPSMPGGMPVFLHA